MGWLFDTAAGKFLWLGGHPMGLRRALLTLFVLAFLGGWSPEFAAAQTSTAANYDACLYGSPYGCNPSLLSDAQRAAVGVAAARRNYDACLYGSPYGCNPSLLSDAQRAAVGVAAA